MRVGGIHSQRQGGQVRCHREADSVVWQLRLADAGLGVEGGQRRVWLGAGSRGSQSSSSWRMWENTGLQAALPPRPWRPLLAGAETSVAASVPPQSQWGKPRPRACFLSPKSVVRGRRWTLGVDLSCGPVDLSQPSHLPGPGMKHLTV